MRKVLLRYSNLGLQVRMKTSLSNEPFSLLIPKIQNKETHEQHCQKWSLIQASPAMSVSITVRRSFVGLYLGSDSRAGSQMSGTHAGHVRLLPPSLECVCQ